MTDDRAPAERVAEAIWKASTDPRDRGLRTWRDVINKTHYRALATAAIDALWMTEEWAVHDRYGIAVTSRGGRDGAERLAVRINEEYAEKNKYVAGSMMCAPNAEAVHRFVTPWTTPDGATPVGEQ